MLKQYKPCREFLYVNVACGSVHFIAPLTEVEPLIRTYFDLQLKDTEMVEQLRERYNTEQYNIG